MIITSEGKQPFIGIAKIGSKPGEFHTDNEWYQKGLRRFKEFIIGQDEGEAHIYLEGMISLLVNMNMVSNISEAKSYVSYLDGVHEYSVGRDEYCLAIHSGTDSQGREGFKISAWEVCRGD